MSLGASLSSMLVAGSRTCRLHVKVGRMLLLDCNQAILMTKDMAVAAEAHVTGGVTPHA